MSITGRSIDLAYRSARSCTELLLQLRRGALHQLHRLVLFRACGSFRLNVEPVFGKPRGGTGKHRAIVSERTAEPEPVRFDDQPKKIHASGSKGEMVGLETRSYC